VSSMKLLSLGAVLAWVWVQIMPGMTTWWGGAGVGVGADHARDDDVVGGVYPPVHVALVALPYVFDPVAFGHHDAVPEEPVLGAVVGDDPFPLDSYRHVNEFAPWM